MASLLLRSRSLAKCSSNFKWASAPCLSTSSARHSDDINKAIRQKEAPQIENDRALLNPKEAAHKTLLQNYITVEGPTNVAPISGIPEEQFRTRRIRIYEPPKNAMQSGTSNIGHWELEWDNKERWENPLMGWSSTGDPLSNLKVQFSNKDEAVEYCEKNGWEYFVQESCHNRPFKPKSYGVNYAWNKRTRVSTK